MSQKRKLEDPNEAFCQTPPKKSRTQYSLDFKLNVLDNAKSFSSNRTLASHFHIDEKQIRQWKKDESKLRSSKEHENGSRKRVEGAGLKDFQMSCMKKSQISSILFEDTLKNFRL